jgi:hypothetical protein
MRRKMASKVSFLPTRTLTVVASGEVAAGIAALAPGAGIGTEKGSALAAGASIAEADDSRAACHRKTPAAAAATHAARITSRLNRPDEIAMPIFLRCNRNILAYGAQG